MPHLLLVIDEFGELLTAEPDFVDLLLTIGRIGRFFYLKRDDG